MSPQNYSLPLAALLALIHSAGAVTLAWDASATPDVVYRLKWGFASGSINHTHVVDVNTALTATVDEPWPIGVTVYFTCYAVNDSGDESLPSNEVAYQVPIPTPTHDQISAVYLGQTGQNLVGRRVMGARGEIDRQIQVTGISGIIAKVKIAAVGTRGPRGLWETPYNGNNWIVAIVPTSDPSIVDLFFEPYHTAINYLVTITYSDNGVVSAQTTTTTN